MQQKVCDTVQSLWLQEAPHVCFCLVQEARSISPDLYRGRGLSLRKQRDVGGPEIASIAAPNGNERFPVSWRPSTAINPLDGSQQSCLE